MPSPGRVGDIAARLAAVSIMVPLAVGAAWLGDWAFAALIILCAGLVGREWARLCRVIPNEAAGWLAMTAPMTIVAAAAATGQYVLGLVASVGLAAILLLLFRAKLSNGAAHWLAAGAIMIPAAGEALIWMRGLEEAGLAMIVWLFAVVWTTDTSAFFTGRLLRGPLLAPKISPAKTWAGLLGGLTGAAVVGAAASALFASNAAALTGLIIGLIVGMVSAAGDLLESLMKRHFQVKDSGGLIPGHGGVLDRLDSLMLAAPAAAVIYLMGWRWV